MPEAYPANVDIIYAEGNHRVRQTMSAALKSNGYRGLRDYRELGDAAHAIQVLAPDIFLVDEFEANTESFDVIKRLRHYELGKNPFLSVIVCCERPSGGTVGRFINSGVDYLVVKPLSPDQLISRFKTIARKRKPFEVTSDYIGPDRSEFEKFVDGARGGLIEVPNTVGMKSQREAVGPKKLGELVSEAMARINIERLNQNAGRIAFLLARMVERVNEGETNGPLSADADRILQIISDIENRYPSDEPRQALELCVLVSELINKLLADPTEVEENLLGLLKPLAGAIQLCFRDSEEAPDIAQRVLQMARRVDI